MPRYARKFKKMKKVSTVENPIFKDYPRETEFTYTFAAVDDHYGLFYCCLVSKKRLSHDAIKGYIEEVKKLIDVKGSPGLSEWYEMMEERGFRPLPSTAAILGDQLTVLDCVPPVDRNDDW